MECERRLLTKKLVGNDSQVRHSELELGKGFWRDAISPCRNLVERVTEEDDLKAGL